MRLSILTVLCLLSACNQNNTCTTNEPPPPSDGGGGGDTFPGGGNGFGGGEENTGGGNQNIQIVLVGEPTTVTTSVGIVFDSCNQLVSPSTATSTVVGPDNLPVASTENGLSDNQGLDYSDNVMFTPQTPGEFHIVTTFDPNLGVAQVDVPAAIDRSGLATQATYDATMTQLCTGYLITNLGTLLCTGTDNQIHVFRASVALDAYDGIMVAVHGSSIWIVELSGEGVLHYIDTGGSALTPADPPSITTDTMPTGLVPGDNDVVVLLDDHAVLYAANDAGFFSSFEWTGASGMIAAARNGTSLIAYGSAGLIANTDGGTTLAPITGTTNFGCVGYGPEGLWVTDTTGALDLFTPGTHSASATLSGLIGWSAPSPAPANSLPYGVAPTTLGTVANAPQTVSVTLDSVSSQPVISAWGDLSSISSIANSGWVVAVGASGGVVVKAVPAP